MALMGLGCLGFSRFVSKYLNIQQKDSILTLFLCYTNMGDIPRNYKTRVALKRALFPVFQVKYLFWRPKGAKGTIQDSATVVPEADIGSFDKYCLYMFIMHFYEYLVEMSAVVTKFIVYYLYVAF